MLAGTGVQAGEKARRLEDGTGLDAVHATHVVRNVLAQADGVGVLIVEETGADEAPAKVEMGLE